MWLHVPNWFHACVDLQVHPQEMEVQKEDQILQQKSTLLVKKSAVVYQQI